MKKFLSMLTLCSCIVGGTVGSAMAEEIDVKATVESANATWNNTFNSGDSTKLATLYAGDALLSPGNGQVLKGREQIAELFKSFIDNGVHNHTIETVSTYHDGNQIVQVANWNAQGVNEQKETISFGGVFMSVLEQNEDGDWVAKSHVWNMGG
jgi:uncharacterized protein (TIGR02246 family)